MYGQGYTQSYGYNPIGNLISTTMLGMYTYPTSGPTSVRPHAVTVAGGNLYQYDANGNMTQRVEVSGTQRITWEGSQGAPAEYTQQSDPGEDFADTFAWYVQT